MKPAHKNEDFDFFRLRLSGTQATGYIRVLTERIRKFIDYADTLEAEEMDEGLFISFLNNLRNPLEFAEKETGELVTLLDSFVPCRRRRLLEDDPEAHDIPSAPRTSAVA